ncbi:MAG: hypothetical protein WBQ50_13580 [Nocardioides sp.]
MSTMRTTTDKRPVLTRVAAPTSRSCRCGQQLDVCARAHCPRCGRTLHRD